MITYRRVDAETYVRRDFEITVSLVEGYGGGRVHSHAEIEDVIGDWVVSRANAGEPYLTAWIARGRLMYVWPRPEPPGEKFTQRSSWFDTSVEDIVAVRGVVNPLYQADMTDAQAHDAIVSLATALGQALGQVRIYCQYRDEIWVLEREKEDTS